MTVQTLDTTIPNRTPAEAISQVKFHASLNVSDLNRSVRFYAALFGESPGRVVVATGDPEGVERLAAHAGVQVTGLGRVSGERLVLQGMADLPVDQIRAAGRRSLGEVAVVGTPGQASG